MRQLALSTLRLAALALLLSARAHASPAEPESLRVLKTSGRRATVEFDREAPAPGTDAQVVWLGDGPPIHDPSRLASKRHFVGGSANLSSLLDSRSQITTTALAVDARYGWNWARYEAGPTVALGYTQSDPLTQKTLEVGGFFDFNFVPNDESHSSIYGIGGALRLGQADRTKGTASFSNGLTTFEIGPFAKWFVFKWTFACLRADLLYSSQTIGGDAPYATTVSGMLARGGFQIYF